MKIPTRPWLVCLVAFVAFVPLTSAQNLKKTPPQVIKVDETPHLEFVKEITRELAAVEEIRVKAEKELKDDPKNPFSGMIHSGTLFKLELGADINQLQQMHLSDPYDTVIPIFIEAYESKIVVWDRLVKISQEFMAGPQAAVDYGKMGAEVPELRAKLDYVDQTIFQSMPLVASTLINLKRTNSQGHCDHLIITRAERKDLIDDIDTSFGEKIDAKDQNYTVSAASVLKGFLKKDFKSADDPWD